MGGGPNDDLRQRELTDPWGPAEGNAVELPAPFDLGEADPMRLASQGGEAARAAEAMSFWADASASASAEGPSFLDHMADGLKPRHPDELIDSMGRMASGASDALNAVVQGAATNHEMRDRGAAEALGPVMDAMDWAERGLCGTPDCTDYALPPGVGVAYGGVKRILRPLRALRKLKKPLQVADGVADLRHADGLAHGRHAVKPPDPPTLPPVPKAVPDALPVSKAVLRQREAAERVHEESIQKGVARSRKGLAKPKQEISEADLAYVDESTPEGKRRLRNASDPDRGINAGSIDEARVMEHAETTKQLPDPVNRSTQPGADVMTGNIKEGTDVHYSMKAIHTGRPGQLDDSVARVRDTIATAVRDRLHGDSVHPILCDLTKLDDLAVRSRIRAELLADINQANVRLTRAGHATLTLRFIE